MAEKTQTERVSFHLHDVTLTPFPDGPSDVIYARFVLTHQHEPEKLIERWISQLARTGLLLIEENEWIRSTNSTFVTYLQITRKLLERQGNNMYLGPLLEQFATMEGVRKQASVVRTLPVATARAATLFALNLKVWKTHPFIQGEYSADVLGRLENQLDDLTMTESGSSEIVWGLRQIVYERV
jgi:hypothetical protein